MNTRSEAVLQCHILSNRYNNDAHSHIDHAEHCAIHAYDPQSMTVYTQTKVTATHNTPILVSPSWIIAAAVFRKTAYPTALELAYSFF